MTYELYYWPSIQGRGEFVRLALEDVAAPYVDVARRPEKDGNGMDAMLALMNGAGVERPPFAPPFLRAGSLLIGQTANILQFLGERHALAPKSLAGRLWVHQLQLTIADLVLAVHDTHHPISVNLYYEDQTAEAKRRSDDFVKSRLPKFLGYFERVLEGHGTNSHYLAGSRRTYADLSLFQTVAGLRYAFPRAMSRLEKKHPHIVALHDRIAGRPRIRSYIQSGRRIPFNQHGIFRHYPELDR